MPCFIYTVIIAPRQGHAFVDVDARKQMMPTIAIVYLFVLSGEVESCSD
jgi:hypothetical protein